MHKGDQVDITYTDVKNPQWITSDRTAIVCEVNFDHIPEEYAPFCAVASGDLPHTHKIFAECVEGKWGDIKEFVPLNSETNVSIQMK
jgi:hypothetical protein